MNKNEENEKKNFLRWKQNKKSYSFWIFIKNEELFLL